MKMQTIHNHIDIEEWKMRKQIYEKQNAVLTTEALCFFLSSHFNEHISCGRIFHLFFKCCNGIHQRFMSFPQSATLTTDMPCCYFISNECKNYKLPTIYYLAGLSMSYTEFMEKSGAQRLAAKYGIILISPDSSPRKTGIAGESDKWYMGTKASYYIDATEEPWSRHFKMHSYVADELPKIVDDNFPVIPNMKSIIGHSIGGHGAFVLTFKHPDKFRSVSAISPVCDLRKAPITLEGMKAYLGECKDDKWDNWSATYLAEHYRGRKLLILIDQGTGDEFLKEHLFLDMFVEACNKSPDIDVKVTMRDDYGHDYYLVSTCIENHIKFHLEHLK